jgi:hypothetical protein
MKQLLLIKSRTGNPLFLPDPEPVAAVPKIEPKELCPMCKERPKDKRKYSFAYCTPCNNAKQKLSRLKRQRRK